MAIMGVIIMDLLERYRENLKKSNEQYSINTIDSYCSDVKNFLQNINKLPKDIMSFDVDKYLKLGAERTARRRFSSIASFYRFLNENNITDNHPTSKEMFDALRVPPKKMAVRLNKEEGFRFLEAAKRNLKTFAIMMTFINTGIRKGELCKLKKDDYDGKSFKIRWDTAKGRKERTVKVNQATQKAIADYLMTRIDDLPYLFISNQNNQYSASAIDSLVDHTAKIAKINKKITPHILRHTFASMMKSQGLDIYELKEILGHSFISTTMIYVDTLEDDRQQELMEKSVYNVEW